MGKESAKNRLFAAEPVETVDAEILASKLTGLTRQNSAKLVHEWLRDVRREPDERNIEAALRLRDIYDCHACLNHVAQVYVKGIMTAGGGIFGMKEMLSEREAAEIAERAVKPEKRLRVAGAITSNTSLREVCIEAETNLTGYDLLIDVRSPEEYAEGHLAGAVNIPLSECLEDPVAFAADRDAEILFMCSHGIKSRIAAEAAIRAGFRNVSYAGIGIKEQS